MIAVKHLALALLFAGNLCFVAIASNDQLPSPSGRGAGGEGGSAVRSSHQSESMFPDGCTHDFSAVQYGTQLYHAFRIVNTSKAPLHIVDVRISMGVCKIQSSKEVLSPGEAGEIRVWMDTRLFRGTRTNTFYVSTESGNLKQTHRLLVQARSEENLAFFPDTLDFGKISRMGKLTKSMVVSVSNQPGMQITSARCDNKFVRLTVEELARGKTQAAFRVTATILRGVPDGELLERIELSTSAPTMPRLIVPLSATVHTP
jgi:hypothetical protein